MFDCSGPFRSLVGSIPFSFHPFVLPFLPTSMYRFFPSSFHTFFPSSLDPFIHFSLRPCTHSSILPFILSSIGPFILSCFLPSTFHRSSPSSLHPFFPSSLGAFNPGPAACAKRLNKKLCLTSESKRSWWNHPEWTNRESNLLKKCAFHETSVFFYCFVRFFASAPR